MDLLARREHSRLELRRKLARRFPPSEVQTAIDELAAEGLQSDERFTLSFARQRVLRGRGPRRILLELRERGIDDGLAEQALADVLVETGETWRSLAELALDRRFGARSLEGLSPPERAQRLRFLYQQGFETEDFGPVLG